ncbi:MFS transporter [Peribacillus butanolivorans]|uniref:MFS transporter n=1 Tax=Peribacillus butanolivorans TaxID=421767 RepID=A0AAX0S9Z4_9BACI|nr:MFS transporter [Peribacillus butanolivorans]AXN40153.1 MFS transporter [Peribacillus butanolivorans]MCO0598249.1 MFS transporter [Peribacillus butanolivorans]MED3689119.1 MFS transporter [Peribacillus butanolivorans]PEJ36906.1 MFS transporter [Peribacillus butanolivorans]
MNRFHYSWIILIITFFSIIVAGIVRSSSGVFIVPFENEFGWDRSVISLAFAISLFLYGLSGPFMAALIEVLGLKKMMVFAMSTLLAGVFLTFFMEHEWQLILIWGIIIGLGSGLFLTVLSPYVANRWFEKRRGLAVGILTASTATGQLVLLPVLAIIIENYSWRWAIGLIMVLSLIMLAIILLFMKNNPKEVGILPYGLEEESQEANLVQKKNPIVMAFQSLIEAVRVKEFWLLAGSFFICGLSTSGLIGTHFISYCISFGLPVVTAASLLSFMGIFDLIGTTVSGWLSDRFDNRWLLFWYYGLRGASLVLLPFALQEGSIILLIIFSVFYGLDWIATVPPTISISRQVFGIEKSGIVYGWIFASHQAGAAAAAYGGGLIFKIFSSYTWAFFLAGIFCVLGSLFVILIKKQKSDLLVKDDAMRL